MTSEEFSKAVTRPGVPVVVEFWAPWCGPCRMMAPALEQASQKFAGQVELFKVNADENAEIVRELRIMAIPTILVYRDGQETLRQVGAQTPRVLIDLFSRLASGEGGQAPPLPKPGMDPVARAMRLGAGLFLILLGIWLTSWLAVAAGALVTFWGVHDRCPIWQAVAPRLKALLSRPGTD